MAFAATVAEHQTLSAYSLNEPPMKNLRATVSFPFVKPNLGDKQQEIVKIIEKFKKFCQEGFKKEASKITDQTENLTLEDSKHIIRELAAELDRVVQSKKCPLMSGKLKNKGKKEEQEYYILQWAEELEDTQTKQTDIEQNPPVISENCLDNESKVKRAKKILTDWSWKLKQMKENSVCPKGECEETLWDLHGKWKRRESSILPVMDWMMWTVLHPECSEWKDSVPRQWVKNKQRSKNTVGLPIPNSAWSWITKSTANVILDPNTANPDLLISEDGKSLRAREYTGVDNWHGFQRKRTKYDGWTCVQAKDGYETGRHYWEVDVRWKSEWRVGVVKESAPRNGFVTMNTKTGYWNLRLQLGTLIALTEPVTKLNLLKPSKIGVYLDIDEGHVSFYDAEKKRHLYTFNMDFDRTEKLYPVFGTVETNKPLFILSQKYLS